MNKKKNNVQLIKCNFRSDFSVRRAVIFRRSRRLQGVAPRIFRTTAGSIVPSKRPVTVCRQIATSWNTVFVRYFGLMRYFKLPETTILIGVVNRFVYILWLKLSPAILQKLHCILKNHC